MNTIRPLHLATAIAVTLLAGCSTHRSQTPSATTEEATPRDETRQRADVADKENKRDAPLTQEFQLDKAEVGGRLSAPVGTSTQPPLMRSPVTVVQPKLAANPATLAAPPIPPYEAANRENYADHDDNPVQRTIETPVSTFSIDVDTGSYANVRHMLVQGRLPPADAVRAEEFINYFDYDYAPPRSIDPPFSVTVEAGPAPWNAQRQLLLVGIQGYRVDPAEIPASNLVFLIDTSGSMQSPDKIDLLKSSFKAMVSRLRAQDRVSIVVYAGSAGLVLPPTSGSEHDKIIAALDQLQAGGSTNGGAGIELAYATAKQAFIQGGVNRVLLATDGDFNVGTTDMEALKTLIIDRRKSGVALTTLGFGEGNYNDALAEQLADVGNGNHYYIDTPSEGRKVLVDSLSATLLTIAKDVKIQIEFNPSQVAEYRLIGYENRLLRREDFNNDQIDAGEIGAGHNVTALYELVLKDKATQIDPLRYGGVPAPAAKSDELAFLRLRYKPADGETSKLIERPIALHEVATPPNKAKRLQFAAAVAAFADALRGGTHLDGFSLDRIATLAETARGDDRGDENDAYRIEFAQLVRRAGEFKDAGTRATAAIAR